MMGPIGLLPLFAKSTAGADARLQKTIAVRAAIFATLALAVAVFVGAAIMQSAGTSRSSLIIASGVILTLTALRNIFGSGSPQSSAAQPASEALALAPIAIPGIVTPMGVAILILFASYFPEMVDRLAILAVMVGIMLANLLAMFSAQWFMRGQCQIKNRVAAGAGAATLDGMSSARIFRYFKTSPEIIRLAVMMYVRYPLSLRNVEDLLHERGIDITHETVRFWWNRFGTIFAAEIRRSRVQAMRNFRHRRWHLDEVFVKINGVKHYLWRAVDHEGEVLESFVTKRRDKKAALKFLRKSLRMHGPTETIVTDRLASYGAALKSLGAIDKRQVGRWLNNRVENSHQPFRRRERAMLRFRQMRSLQKFAAVHGSIHNHFSQERHLSSRPAFKERRTAALNEWRQLCAA